MMATLGHGNISTTSGYLPRRSDTETYRRRADTCMRGQTTQAGWYSIRECFFDEDEVEG
jgi:hypothetical protein